MYSGQREKRKTNDTNKKGNLKTEKLRKTYKVVVRPTPESISTLWLLSKAMTHLWNIARQECDSRLEEGKKMQNLIEILEKKGGSVYLKFRNGSELMCSDIGLPLARKMIGQFCSISSISLNFWLTEARKQTIKLADGQEINLYDLSSDLEREVLRKLAGSYQSFFALKKAGDARAKTPWNREDGGRFMTLSWSSFSIESGILRAPSMTGQRVGITIGQYLEDKIREKDVVHSTIAYRNGQFELSLVTSIALPEKNENPSFFRAIDLGAGDVAVTDSDGSEFIIPLRRPDKFWRKEVRQIENRARLRVKRSAGWKRLMRARRHIWNKCLEQQTSFQRKLASALVEPKVDCIIIGKPKTRLGLAKSEKGTKDEHFGVQNTGYMFRLLRFIKEKTEERGVKFIETPDPPRKGVRDNPETKLTATRTMLAENLAERHLSMPTDFKRKHFSFQQ